MTLAYACQRVEVKHPFWHVDQGGTFQISVLPSSSQIVSVDLVAATKIRDNIV